MSLLAKPGRNADLYHIFRDQFDQIKNKRTAVIKLSNFPNGISLGIICEVLAEILSQFSPLVYLERLILADNSLKALPAEFELVCGPYLRFLDLHNNSFSTVPEIIGGCCSHLEGLDLSLNHLTSLSPSVFKELLDLKLVLLKNNEINYLPPFLGEMINLDVIGVAENPLLIPTLEKVKAMPGINDLKAYLLSNSGILEQHIQLQAQHIQKAPTTPSATRTRSFTESGGRSLKASRRKGFIINSNKTTPEDSSRPEAAQLSSQDAFSTPSKPERKLLSEKSDIATGLERRDVIFNRDFTSGSSTYTTSTSSRSRSSSPSGANYEAPSSRLGSRNRSRWIALRDNSGTVESNELADTEHKPGASFRRLSTLQERPTDEMYRTSQEDLGVLSQNEAAFKRSQPVENSPPKNASRKPSLNGQPFGDLNPYHGTTIMYQPDVNSGHDMALTLRVAKILFFSLSEVHISFERLIGFCSDKKVVLKVVTVLHTSKVRVDLLRESVEAAEGSGDNLMNALHNSIKSFKQIFEVIADNIASFVANVELCFVRTVYLTLFGSFNEMQNAYRLLNPLGVPTKVPAAIPRNQSGLVLTALHSKMKHAQPAVTSEELVKGSDSTSELLDTVALEEKDEQLYQCIDLATANAETVFSELTTAIRKSAIASANTNGSQTINLDVSTKFKELTDVCISSMDITKRLKLKLSSIRSNQTPLARRLFWDDVSLFLKAIILTFSSVKAIMKDAPILNEVRQSMATLTKTTKELMILLDGSSYKSMSDMVSAAHLQASLSSAVPPPSAPPSLNSLPSTSAFNLPQLLSTTLVRTPLVATVGAAAAQAILPSSDLTLSNSSTSNVPVSFTSPPLVSSDVLNTGLHTAPVQSMEQYYAKNTDPFDRIS